VDTTNGGFKFIAAVGESRVQQCIPFFEFWHYLILLQKSHAIFRIPFLRRCLFLRSQSPAPEQLTFRTRRPGTRANAGDGVLNAQERNSRNRVNTGVTGKKNPNR